MRYVTAEEMKKIDRSAQTRFRVPEMVMMEHAGLAVARLALSRLRKCRASALGKKKRVLILCGKGANGGDGFVAARHLDNWGVEVVVVLMASPNGLRGSSKRNFEMLKPLSVERISIGSRAEWNRWCKTQERFELLIDALLGTGFSGEVREPILSVVQWLNQKRTPVISVDVPSGLSADSGLPSKVAVRAQETVSCGLPKVGFLKSRAKKYVGEVVHADIALPQVLRQ